MPEKPPQILQRESPVLREKAKAVSKSEIGSEKIVKIIADMQTAMHSQKDGIAIAAPQIGHSLKIFVISGKLLKEADRTYKGDGGDLVFINPAITKKSRDKKSVEEGCLSVRWLYGIVKRSTRVSIEYLNEKGQKIERGASGLLAQIFQHEIDHLDGVLFTDHASETWEMDEADVKELQRG